MVIFAFAEPWKDPKLPLMAHSKRARSCRASLSYPCTLNHTYGNEEEIFALRTDLFGCATIS
jgi:hypothetical protein